MGVGGFAKDRHRRLWVVEPARGDRSEGGKGYGDGIVGTSA